MTNSKAEKPFRRKPRISRLALLLLPIAIQAIPHRSAHGSHAIAFAKGETVFGSPEGAGTITSSEQHFGIDAATGIVSKILYVSDRDAARSLGCPIDHHMSCFYRFDNSPEDHLTTADNATIFEGDCALRFAPIDPDKGRPWCVRKGGKPPYLENLKRWQVPGVTLVVGNLDGPNPTHQANLHFMPIWYWMRKSGLLPGQLQLLIDSTNSRDFSPGKFGTGIANALGSVEWLPDLPPGVIEFEHIKFSFEPRGSGESGFPFLLRKFQLNKPADLGFVEMAENVKLQLSKKYMPHMDLQAWFFGEYRSPPLSHLELDPEQKLKLRAVVSQRRITESRHWDNAGEVVTELEGLDMNARLAVMGELSFEEQVQMMAAADVLVGVHGSDLLNMLWLPLGGSVVEIFPKVDRKAMYIPELPNLSGLLAKGHFVYVSSGEVLIDPNEHGVFRVRHMNVTASDVAPLIQLAASQAREHLHLEGIQCSTNFEVNLITCSAPAH